MFKGKEKVDEVFQIEVIELQTLTLSNKKVFTFVLIEFLFLSAWFHLL